MPYKVSNSPNGFPICRDLIFPADVLIRIKPQVAEGGLQRSSSRSMLEDLEKLATLAEAFTQQRQWSKEDWLPMADALDREGMESGVA